MDINYLRIPIGYLYDIDDLNNFPGFKKSGLEHFLSGYEKSEINGIIEALEWAAENPNYDFTSMLPGIKHSNKDIYEYMLPGIKHSNKDIYEYLCGFEEALRKP